MKEIPIELLKANCRVRTHKAGGSGTVLYSGRNKDGDYSTYILTNHHVVEDSIKIEKKWSTLLKRETKIDVMGVVNVEFFKWQYQSRAVGSINNDADIMAYDRDEDLALLKLRDGDEYPFTANIYPRGKETELRLGFPLIAIGAAMGNPPVITEGLLSQFAIDLDNREFWLSTAPTIFGNSGGAVYLGDTHQFIGVPARIAVALLGFSADAITHLSYFIPVTRVYNFLEEQLFRFIYDSGFTEEEEAKARDAKRKDEEFKIAAKESKTPDETPSPDAEEG